MTAQNSSAAKSSVPSFRSLKLRQNPKKRHTSDSACVAIQFTMAPPGPPAARDARAPTVGTAAPHPRPRGERRTPNPSRRFGSLASKRDSGRGSPSKSENLRGSPHASPGGAGKERRRRTRAAGRGNGPDGGGGWGGAKGRPARGAPGRGVRRRSGTAFTLKTPLFVNGARPSRVLRAVALSPGARAASPPPPHPLSLVKHRSGLSRRRRRTARARGGAPRPRGTRRSLARRWPPRRTA